MLLRRGRPEVYGWDDIDECDAEAVGMIKQAGISAMAAAFEREAFGATARLGQALKRAMHGPLSLMMQNTLAQLHEGPVILLNVAHIGASSSMGFGQRLTLSNMPLEQAGSWIHVISQDIAWDRAINVSKALGILGGVSTCRSHDSGRSRLCWGSQGESSVMMSVGIQGNITGLFHRHPWLDLVVNEGQPGEVGEFGLTAPMRATIAVPASLWTTRSGIELAALSPGLGLSEQSAASTAVHTFPDATSRDAGLTMLRATLKRVLSRHSQLRRRLSHRWGVEAGSRGTMLHLELSRPWMAADVEAIVAVLGSGVTLEQAIGGVTMLIRHAEQPDIATALALLPPHWPRILLPTGRQTAAMLVIACRHRPGAGPLQEPCGSTARGLRLLRRAEMAAWDALSLCSGGPQPAAAADTLLSPQHAHALASVAWAAQAGPPPAPLLAAWSPPWRDWLCSDALVSASTVDTAQRALMCQSLRRVPLPVLVARFLISRAEDVWQQRYPLPAAPSSSAPVRLGEGSGQEQVCKTPRSAYPRAGLRLHGVLSRCIYAEPEVGSAPSVPRDDTVAFYWPSFNHFQRPCSPGQGSNGSEARLCVRAGGNETCGPPCTTSSATWQHEPVHFAPLYQPFALRWGWTPGAMPSAVVSDQTARLCGSGCVQSAYHLLFLQHFPDLLPSAWASHTGEAGAAAEGASQPLRAENRAALAWLMDEDRTSILGDSDAWWALYVLAASPWTRSWRPVSLQKKKTGQASLRKPWLASLMRSDKLFAPGHGLRSWLARVAMGIAEEVRVGARALADPTEHAFVEPGAWVSRGVASVDSVTVMGAGSGHMSMRDIDDGFAPFQASFVVENQRMGGWWTEKLLSALLWQTVPIYWGSPTVAVSDSLTRVPSHRSRWFAATCGRCWGRDRDTDDDWDGFGSICWQAEDGSGDWFVRLDARGIVVLTTEAAMRKLASNMTALRLRVAEVPRGSVVHNWAVARELRAQQVTRHMYAGMGGVSLTTMK